MRSDRADRLAGIPREGTHTLPDGVAGQREAGVLDDLLRRQAALPPGHPSARPDTSRQAEVEPERADLDSRSDLADADERGLWSKVSRFKQSWQEHLIRWPDKQDQRAEPDRRGDPPGSWRGVGDRYLTPAQNAEADKQIELLHKPEEAVTKLLKQIEHQNPHGAVLVGLEHSRKGTERLKEKLTDKMNASSDSTVADAAAMIDDAVRYTFCFGIDDYAKGHDHVQRSLQRIGYKLAYTKNHWLNDPQYKGINSRWITPDGGKFELQFHTRESFYAKEQLTHASYRRLRTPSTTRAERLELAEFERNVSSAVTVPPAATQIPSYRTRT